MTKNESFEDRLNELKEIDTKLNSGLGLQDTLNYFSKGKKLANSLTKTINQAKKKFAKVETSDGKEVPYDRDKGGKDINNNAKVDSSTSDESLHIPSDNPY